MDSDESSKPAENTAVERLYTAAEWRAYEEGNRANRSSEEATPQVRAEFLKAAAVSEFPEYKHGFTIKQFFQCIGIAFLCIFGLLIVVSIFGSNDSSSVAAATESTNNFDEPTSKEKDNKLTNKISQLEDKHPTIISDRKYFYLMPKKLKEKKKMFFDYMVVASSVEKVDGGFFGAGCLPHQCDANASAWFVSDDGKKSVAVIEHTEPNDPSLVGFMIYGANYKNLPASILAWGVDRGMSEQTSARQDN